MSLFKISRGAEANLPSTLKDGYAYYTTDGHNFFVDYINAQGTLMRSKISAEYADKLRYTQDGDTIEINPAEIITQSYFTVGANGVLIGDAGEL